MCNLFGRKSTCITHTTNFDDLGMLTLYTCLFICGSVSVAIAIVDSTPLSDSYSECCRE